MIFFMLNFTNKNIILENNVLSLHRFSDILVKNEDF